MPIPRKYNSFISILYGNTAAICNPPCNMYLELLEKANYVTQPRAYTSSSFLKSMEIIARAE